MTNSYIRFSESQHSDENECNNKELIDRNIDVYFSH